MVKLHGRTKRKEKGKPGLFKVSVHRLLEAGTLESMRNAKQVTDEHLKYHWKHYAELAG